MFVPDMLSKLVPQSSLLPTLFRSRLHATTEREELLLYISYLQALANRPAPHIK